MWRVQIEVSQGYQFCALNYSADIVVQAARDNLDKRFCLIGKGKYFVYFDKPDNIEWIPREMTHEEMRKYINSSKIALMPTREDIQGLMSCETAAFGISLITSDIEVCREILGDCTHVVPIDNEKPDIVKATKEIEEKFAGTDHKERWLRYFAENTIGKEIEFLVSYAKR